MRRGDEVSLQGVVCRAVLVLRSGRCGEPVERAVQRFLRLSEQQFAEAVEIGAARFGEELAAGVEAPAHTERSAFALVSPELSDGLAQGVELLQRVDGGQVQSRGFRGGNA